MTKKCKQRMTKQGKSRAEGLTEAMHISSRRLAGAGPRLHALSLHQLMQKLLHTPYLRQAPISVSKREHRIFRI